MTRRNIFIVVNKLKEKGVLMKMHTRSTVSGFTLIEILLVLVVISVVLYAAIGYFQQQSIQTRVDKTSLQMQQVLNAGLAYYVANGKWPTSGDNSIDCLQGSGDKCEVPYIVKPFKNPWGNNYNIHANTKGCKDDSTCGLFYTYTKIEAGSRTTGIATMIAGKLPMAYTSEDDGNPPDKDKECDKNATKCFVVSAVNIPGQNLNNANAVNYAGLYHHGACIPVPICPVDANGKTMTPEVMVVPVSVSGINDPNNTSVYPISSFTAYATSNNGTLDDTPLSCNVQGGPAPTPTSCTIGQGTEAPSKQYWRACLQIVTDRGDVSETNNTQWGENVTLMAITRCSIANEPSGSGFDVFTN